MAYNSKRYGGEHKKRWTGYKYVEGDFRNTRHVVRDTLQTFDKDDDDKDIIFNKFNPKAISAWLD
jgi:hypothetical protein